MPVPKEAVGHSLEAYRKQLDLVSETEMGRPLRIPMILNGLADIAAESIHALGGKKLKLEHPEPDKIDEDLRDEEGHLRPQPGRLVPANNPKFLAAHRRNLAALEEELASLTESAE